MGYGYIPHPCSKCGYKHYDEYIVEGRGFVPIYPKLIFCNDCKQIGNVILTPEEVVTKFSQWETTSDYLQHLRKEWGDFINIDKLKFDSTCQNCRSLNYVPLSIEVERTNRYIAWLKCPVCNEGKLKLELDIIFD